jgi:hypothetical protein
MESLSHPTDTETTPLLTTTVLIPTSKQTMIAPVLLEHLDGVPGKVQRKSTESPVTTMEPMVQSIVHPVAKQPALSYQKPPNISITTMERELKTPVTSTTVDTLTMIEVIQMAYTAKKMKGTKKKYVNTKAKGIFREGGKRLTGSDRIIQARYEKMKEVKVADKLGLVFTGRYHEDEGGNISPIWFHPKKKQRGFITDGKFYPSIAI